MSSWRGIWPAQQLIRADARVPTGVALPRAADRQVARFLADRRDFPVLEVSDAPIPLSHPVLLEGERKDVRVAILAKDEAHRVGVVIAARPELKRNS